MFTTEEAQYQIAKQSALGVAATSGGVLVTGESSWNVKGVRNKLDNNQVQNDGFKRKSVLGNFTSSAGGTIIYNLHLLGYWLLALCDTLTSAAFTGVEKVTVTNGGSGYTSTPGVTFTGGVGSGAAATAVVVGGSVVAIVMTNHGTGYTGAPTVGFTGGGGGSGAAATALIDLAKFKHTGVLKTGAPLYWTIEKGIVGGTLWRLYQDMALRKMSFNDTPEGICSITDEWVGVGKKAKGTTSFDTTPTEVTGTPGEYANLILLENDLDAAVISELSVDIENMIKEKRVPDSTGKARELRRGGWTVGGSGKAFFENETLANKVDNQTETKFQSTITSPDGSFTRLMPEVNLFDGGEWERSDEGIIMPFSYESTKRVSASSPITFTLINGTASY